MTAASDIHPAALAAQLELYDGADLPRLAFLREVATRGLCALVHDAFAGDVDAAGAAAAGEPLLVRTDTAGDQLEALVALDGDALALLDLAHGRVQVEVAATDRLAAVAALEALRDRFRGMPAAAPRTVSVAFWHCGAQGAVARHRQLDVPRWNEIASNYAAGVAAALARLMALRQPDGGRLLIWRGLPGTGKTYALRALAHAWRDWCGVHYVLDPARLLGGNPAYLLDVLTAGDEEEDPAEPRWRLLVLEDAGDLIVREADRPLALLNLTDGLLGQGTRTLVLITTNEAPERLHPALRRPGRCLADVAFAPLDRAAATAWLARAGCDREAPGPLTLSELYALAGGGAPVADETPAPIRFGFARALA